MRPAGKARRLRIFGIFEGGATQHAGMQRRPNAVATFTTGCWAVTVTHHYEEKIAGRTYQIEVLPVSDSRWRAQIVRSPGIPTSMMPFYGTTPEQAARELGRWLALVYNGTPTWNDSH